MASNPYVNKVELADGTTVMDITDTDAQAGDVAKGAVFYAADGARTVGTLETGNTRVWYGTCDTAEGTQAKVATVAGLTEYKAGDLFVITFSKYQNYNGTPTLNINSLGAKNIRRITGTNAARYEWSGGESLVLLYNGTYFLICNGGFATTSLYGRTRLETTSGTSTSTNRAMTPNSLNLAIQGLVTAVPVYSASETYAVGDKVRYGANQWVCKTAIATAEAWDADHWEQLPTLQAQMDGLFDMTVSEIKAM